MTVVGERYRVDMVLPSGAAVGQLMPDILELLGDEPQIPPRLRQLVTGDGSVLAMEQSLAGANVPDGAVLSLTRVENTPPAPLVHDITEETAGDVDGRSWRWGATARRWTATAASVVTTVTAGLLGQALVESGSAVAVLTVAAVVLGGLAGLAARTSTVVATALALGAGSLGVLAVWTAADVYAWDGVALAGGLAAVVAIFVALLGVTSPLGRGAVTGTWTAGLVGLVCVAGDALGLSPARVAALVAAVAVLSLGVLPRLALIGSGLAALDDRRTTGTPVSRYDVDVALAATHRGLVVATVVIAAAAGVSGAVLAGNPDAWTAPLAGLTALVLAGRSRMFPLVWQVVALYVAAAAVALALLASWVAAEDGRPYAQFATAVAAAAGPLIALTVDLPDHIRVRLRQFADRVEAGAVIALIPVTLGAQGTFTRLLDAFS